MAEPVVPGAGGGVVTWPLGATAVPLCPSDVVAAPPCVVVLDEVEFWGGAVVPVLLFIVELLTPPVAEPLLVAVLPGAVPLASGPAKPAWVKTPVAMATRRTVIF